MFKIQLFQKTWFYHWNPLNLIAKTASPGPGVPVPTLESWKFFDFSYVFYVEHLILASYMLPNVMFHPFACKVVRSPDVCFRLF